MTMPYWVFHEEMLDKMLAAREAERQRQGATEQQTKDETVLIKTFLLESIMLRGDRIG